HPSGATAPDLGCPSKRVSPKPIGLRYTGQVTTTNEDGSTTVDPDGNWLAWSIDNDANGSIAREWTPDGAAFTGPAGAGPGDAIPYDRAYSYDVAGRLVQVRDRTATTTGVDVTDPAQAPHCITRNYGYDRNDNRISKTTTPADSNGACATTGGTAVTRAFDTADRPTTAAGGTGTYAYDLFGRTTTLPASDTPTPAGGAAALSYYDNDLPRSISQGGTTTTFTLDALDRRAVETRTDGTGTTQTVRHYTDTSDNPTWVTTATTAQRYAELIGPSLSLTVDQDGNADLTLANNHGDIVTTVNLPTSTTPATSIEGWNNYDEYGIPSAGNSASTGAMQYGWLGGEQRATTDSGLLLMGVRLYNPATGLFTSEDPIPGGNTNAYTYPTDPINQLDLDGRINELVGNGRSSGASFGPSSYWKGSSRTRATAVKIGQCRIPAKTSPKTAKSAKRVKKKVHKNSNEYQGRSVGYTIYYQHRGGWHTWKYGITSQTDWIKRPNSQLRACRAMMKGSCRTGKNVRFFRNRSGARAWERSKVSFYRWRYGVCPPGQWKSCR
ncbi:RHS repeat-associated core domain-containing protein, partial [Kribbella sancticallisti]|uniref:RHS repeat-associated core domain-containing protein n=1 Tax=Kribbella sancticallisti TaxID=460087 RepID=UPI0031D7B5FF